MYYVCVENNQHRAYCAKYGYRCGYRKLVPWCWCKCCCDWGCFSKYWMIFCILDGMYGIFFHCGSSFMFWSKSTRFVSIELIVLFSMVEMDLLVWIRARMSLREMSFILCAWKNVTGRKWSRWKCPFKMVFLVKTSFLIFRSHKRMRSELRCRCNLITLTSESLSCPNRGLSLIVMNRWIPKNSRYYDWYCPHPIHCSSKRVFLNGIGEWDDNWWDIVSNIKFDKTHNYENEIKQVTFVGSTHLTFNWIR